MRLAILLACATSLFAQSATLTVDQGSASRNPTAGAVAHVWADPNTATQVFDGWTGDVQYLLDQAAWHTTLIMPTAAVNLRATYRTVPAWTARVGTFNGIGVTYPIPSDPIGLIFMFHGTGGTGALEFTSNQFLAFIREAVADGFAVAAFDSQDRTTKLLGTVATGIWNTTITGNGNPDIIRLNGIIQAMRSQGLISAQLPLFAFGQSNGGLFSHFSAPVMSWAAVAISCIPGSVNNGAPLYSGPVIWQLAANDDNLLVGAKGNADALANYESHADRRHPVRLIAWQPQPLYPARFARAGVVPPITLADSQVIFNVFRDNGWLDENDMLRQNPKDLNWRAALPARFSAVLESIAVQLDVTYTAHAYSSESSHLILDLFLRAIGRRAPLLPVSGASFLGPNIAPGAIATLFVGGLATGLQVAASGPEAGLRGVTATLRGNNNIESPVSWFFVSPGQGSFLTPSNTAVGAAVLKIVSGSRRWAIPTTVSNSAPGIFTANPDGLGAPAATILRVTADNSRSTESPFVFDAASARFAPAPLTFGDDRLFLNLYATGVRLTAPSRVQVLIGGDTIMPLFSGDQGEFPGLDQVTLELPRGFAGRGRLDVVVLADGVRSNPVDLFFAN